MHLGIYIYSVLSRYASGATAAMEERLVMMVQEGEVRVSVHG